MDYKLDFEESFVNTSLGRIFLRHHKGTNNLLLLHGLGATTRSWKRFIENMPEQIGIFAIDLLGHGKSDKPDIAYTLDKHLATIDELIKSIGINNFSIMGNSYGGIVALKYAGVSDRIINLIIEDIPVFEDEPKIDILMLKKLMEFDNSEHVMRSTLTGEYWLNTKDVKSALVNLKARTLILWGSKDHLVNVKNAIVLNKMIEGSVLKVFDGGHMPHYSNAKETADAVVEFISMDNVLSAKG